MFLILARVLDLLYIILGPELNSNCNMHVFGLERIERRIVRLENIDGPVNTTLSLLCSRQTLESR